MPAPVVRSASARSCTRTLQPRRASAQAAVSPANPAPTISACRFVMFEACYGFARSRVALAAHGALSWGAMMRANAFQEDTMARLRHIAVCVKDLDKAAEFYAKVFEFKKIGREDLDIGSAIYMSDGVINM